MYPLFDWLRFILASVVVLLHAGLPIGDDTGNFAVCCFLALSGWLIGGILLRSTPADLPRFYFNRSIRIWIPYAFAILFLYTTAALKEGIGAGFWQFLFYDLTFTHYWFFQKIPEVIALSPMRGTGAHFWSISVEEQFYLFAPLAILFLPAGRSLLLWLLLFLAASVVDHHYASIAIGVLAAVAAQNSGGAELAGRWRIALALLAATAIAMFWSHPNWYNLLAPFAALAVVLSCLAIGRRSAVGGFLGGVSFPLYLNHWMGLFAGNRLASMLTLPAGVAIGLKYALAILAGIATYLLIDRWVLKRRPAWYRSTRGRWLTGVAYGLIALGVLVHFLWLTPLQTLSRPLSIVPDGQNMSSP